jgi:hypothetical protein
VDEYRIQEIIDHAIDEYEIIDMKDELEFLADSEDSEFRLKMAIKMAVVATRDTPRYESYAEQIILQFVHDMAEIAGMCLEDITEFGSYDSLTLMRDETMKNIVAPLRPIRIEYLPEYFVPDDRAVCQSFSMVRC